MTGVVITVMCHLDDMLLPLILRLSRGRVTGVLVTVACQTLLLDWFCIVLHNSFISLWGDRKELVSKCSYLLILLLFSPF